jgi:ferrous iron transport protein B
MTYSLHPDYSLVWITGLCVVFLIVLFVLWLSGKNKIVKHSQESLSDFI